MPKATHPEQLRRRLVDLLEDFEVQLLSDDLRQKVRSLVPAHKILRSLGTALVSAQEAACARSRILLYLRRYPATVIDGDELMIVSGIQEWARRVRELRCEFGWPILSGHTVREMQAEGDTLEGLSIDSIKPSQYLLLRDEQDRDAAYRWNLANGIRRRNASVKDKILEYLRSNVAQPVTGEELRYVAKDRQEWTRRVRELRTEEGWPIVTKSSGRPDLPVGTYLLEADRQSPADDRAISDSLRGQVLRRDGYACTVCGWHHGLWNRSDPRHLELHHIVFHSHGGQTTANNLTTLCTLCHDDVHAGRA